MKNEEAKRDFEKFITVKTSAASRPAFVDPVLWAIDKQIPKRPLMKSTQSQCGDYSLTYKCPCCGEITEIFGKSHVDEIAKSFNIPVLAKLPIDPEISKLCDNGLIEIANTELLDNVLDNLKK